MITMRDLKELTKAELLDALGLAEKRSGTAEVLGTLGTFGLGLVVGAGVALLMAPRPGRELRADLRRGFERAVERTRTSGARDDDYEVESPHDEGGNGGGEHGRAL